MRIDELLTLPKYIKLFGKVEFIHYQSTFSASDESIQQFYLSYKLQIIINVNLFNVKLLISKSRIGLQVF
jgi:hypothetical protein